jgi:molecular chaperone DnaJ
VVNVPGGVEDGMRVRLSGEGDVGASKGRGGDLYVTLSVKSHPLFRREKEHLVFDLPLNVAQAALGKTIDVPMLDGTNEEFVVPAGVQSGAVLRKKGQGVPSLNNSRHGDLVALVTIITPKKMSPRTRELFDELADALDEDEEAHAPSNGKSWVRKLKDVLAGENS